MALVAKTGSVSLNFLDVVASVDSLVHSGLTRDVIEVTNLGSTDNWKEFAKGFKDGGEITIEGNYIQDNSTQDATTGVLSDFDNDDTNVSATITYPNGSGGSGTDTMPLALTSFERTGTVNEKITFTATFKVMGKPTLDAT